MLRGIDVSTYQGDIDWAAAKASGLVDFAYAKATEGAHEIDDHYSRNLGGARTHQVPIGAYHFFHPEIDGEVQAQHFLDVVRPRSGDLVPMVDVESDFGCSAQEIIKQLARFNQYVEAHIHQRIVIYTDYGFWNDNVNGSDAFSGHPLWIAEYNHDAEPTLPRGWHDWVLWQNSSSGTVPGIQGHVDLDVLNPSARLRAITLV